MEGDEGDGEENERKADGAGLGCPTWPRVATIGSETTNGVEKPGGVGVEDNVELLFVRAAILINHRAGQFYHSQTLPWC